MTPAQKQELKRHFDMVPEGVVTQLAGILQDLGAEDASEEITQIGSRLICVKMRQDIPPEISSGIKAVVTTLWGQVHLLKAAVVTLENEGGNRNVITLLKDIVEIMDSMSRSLLGASIDEPNF